MEPINVVSTDPVWYPKIEHLKERIALAMRIEWNIRQEMFIEASGVSKFRSFRFNPIQLAGILCTDIVRLRKLAHSALTDAAYNALISMESFLACSLYFESTDTKSFGAMFRNTLQRNQALFDPTTMASIINVLAPQLSSANLFQAFADMIKLTPALHRDLEAAKVGLKWVGVVLEEPDVDYPIVVLQCYELPQDIFDGVFNTAGGGHRRARFPQHRRPLDLRTERAMDFDSNAPDSPASSAEETTVWPDYGLNPGGFLTIRVQSRELAKTQLVTELVWIATQMLALSGAAVSGDMLDTAMQSRVFIDWDMVNFFDLTQKA